MYSVCPAALVSTWPVPDTSRTVTTLFAPPVPPPPAGADEVAELLHAASTSPPNVGSARTLRALISTTTSYGLLVSAGRVQHRHSDEPVAVGGDHVEFPELIGRDGSRGRDVRGAHVARDPGGGDFAVAVAGIGDQRAVLAGRDTAQPEANLAALGALVQRDRGIDLAVRVERLDGHRSPIASSAVMPTSDRRNAGDRGCRDQPGQHRGGAAPPPRAAAGEGGGEKTVEYRQRRRHIQGRVVERRDVLGRDAAKQGGDPGQAHHLVLADWTAAQVLAHVLRLLRFQRVQHVGPDRGPFGAGHGPFTPRSCKASRIARSA